MKSPLIQVQQAEDVSPQQGTKIYDWPTRLFHWIFAALFLTAFLIGKNADDEAPLFSWHMMAGLTLAFVIVLRIMWGIIGTRWARFSSFPLTPGKVFDYFRSVLTGNGTSYSGHNPASAWASIVMFGLALGLAFTGYKMSTGQESETLEEIHEILANAFILVTIAHVAGVLLHVLRKKDGLGMSMFNGTKKAPLSDGIRHNHVLAGLLFLALTGLFAWNLNRNYDPQTRQLSLFGQTLQLGESEEGEADGMEEGEEGEDQSDAKMKGASGTLPDENENEKAKKENEEDEDDDDDDRKKKSDD